MVKQTSRGKVKKETERQKKKGKRRERRGEGRGGGGRGKRKKKGFRRVGKAFLSLRLGQFLRKTSHCGKNNHKSAQTVIQSQQATSRLPQNLFFFPF